MNAFLSFLLCAVSVAAAAQSSRQSVTTTQINDDGRMLSVRVAGQANGRTIDYQHTFDVARLNDRAKDALKDRIFDSLGIGQAPKPPMSPAPPDVPNSSGVVVPGNTGARQVQAGTNGGEQPNVTFRCETCTGKIKLTITQSTGEYSFERATTINSQKRFFPYELPLHPGEYRLQYVQNDVLQTQSTFTVKAGEENTVIVK